MLIKGEFQLSLALDVSFAERVEFKAVLEKGNRFQVPKIIRWKFKLESRQPLKVSVTAGGMVSFWETFYSCMDKSGRITVSRLMQKQMLRAAADRRSLVRDLLQIRLEVL